MRNSLKWRNAGALAAVSIAVMLRLAVQDITVLTAKIMSKLPRLVITRNWFYNPHVTSTAHLFTLGGFIRKSAAAGGGGGSEEGHQLRNDRKATSAAVCCAAAASASASASAWSLWPLAAQTVTDEDGGPVFDSLCSAGAKTRSKRCFSHGAAAGKRAVTILVQSVWDHYGVTVDL